MTDVRSTELKLTVLGWLATVATSLAFLPALSQQVCITYGAALSAVVFVTGALLRRLRWPAGLVLLGQVVVAAEVLLVVVGRHTKYAVWPTSDTLSTLRAQVEHGIEVANTYAAPAPPDIGLLLMVVSFIALVAALVDFFVAGLRRPPLAGLPLLALYAVPVAALPDGVPLYGFVPGAVAFIALLMASERKRVISWGRLVSHPYRTDDTTDGMDVSGMAATGRRIGTVALVAAVFVPVFVPVFSTTLWGRSVGKGGDGTGTTLTFSDPMVSLVSGLRRPHPVNLLHVVSDISPQYLRLAVLDTPGPNAWQSSLAGVKEAVPLAEIPNSPRAVSPAVPTSPHKMTIEIDDGFPHDSAWLPVPDLLRYLTMVGGSNWAYVPSDQTVAARSELAVTSVGAYDMSYDTMSPRAAQLRAAEAPPSAIEQRYGGVPSNLPPIIARTARRVTAGATDEYARALYLQDFFRNRRQFSYDLNAGYGYGYQAMAKFLRIRRGFCQQYAATMAMMARTLGIPSRVVVGFLQPDRSHGNSYVFTTKDLHSWPELYFSGVGWIRFEPTQGVGAPYPSWAQHVHLGKGNGPDSATTAPFIDKATRSAPTSASPRSPLAPLSNSGGGSSGLRLPSKSWLVPLGALAVLFLPASLRLGIRRNRLTRPVEPTDAAEAAWRELRDFLQDLHLPWWGSMTPRARQRQLAPLVDDDPEAAKALRRLALCVEQARYAASLPSDVSPATDVGVVTAAILRDTRNGDRVRALLFPVSLLSDFKVAWGRLRRTPDPQ